jgi:hypothetical protein
LDKGRKRPEFTILLAEKPKSREMTFVEVTLQSLVVKSFRQDQGGLSGETL